MKIKLVSDLHLEFSDISIQNENQYDVLILSGDILIAEDLYNHPEINYSHLELQVLEHGQARAQRFRDFLKRCSFQFPHVIYIAGNHEFYHGKWLKTLQVLREECAKFPNIYFLERDTKVIDDVVFIGATLWTDMNRGDPLTLHATKSLLNDFRLIRNDEKGFTSLKPMDTAIRHRDTLEYFREVLRNNENKKCVIVGHHTPSWQSCHERYRGDSLMNACYHSELSEFILDHPQIKLWTHGHTHHPFDYMIGDTRIVCNPRGYEGYEADNGWNPQIMIEV